METIKKTLGLYSYIIEQETPGFGDIIAKIYYNGILIEGQGAYGGTQRFNYDFTFIKPSDNGSSQYVKGVLGVEQSILNQFEIHSLSPRFYNSSTKEYYPPYDFKNSGNLPYTNDKGEVNFELTSSIEPNSNPSSSTSLPTITISAPGYESIEKIPYKGDGTAKEDLGIIHLTPIQDGLESDKLKSSQLDTKQIEEISSSKRDFKYFAQTKLTNLVNTIKTTLIPLVLTLIAKFGITKVSKLIEKGKTKAEDIKDQITCPTPSELSQIISRKNKTVKQLNNTLKIIDTTTKALGITEGILLLLDATLFTADNTPTYINPFPPGLNKILSKTIDGLKSTNSGLLVVLVLLKQVLTQTVQYLNLLDSLIQHCAPDSSQEQLAGELTALTVQQANQLTPVITIVNGFTMGVETEVTDKPLKRRRAIATNKNGVVVLQGEWSFSSIDQILIDELVFYIQQNNLKAD